MCPTCEQHLHDFHAVKLFCEKNGLRSEPVYGRVVAAIVRIEQAKRPGLCEAMADVFEGPETDEYEVTP